MRAGSHADSLWGPLWNSNWSQIELTHFFYPRGKKIHTAAVHNRVCTAQHTQIFSSDWGKFEVLCILSLEKSGPQNMSQIVISICFHCINQRQAKAEVFNYTYAEKNLVLNSLSSNWRHMTWICPALFSFNIIILCQLLYILRLTMIHEWVLQFVSNGSLVW